MMNEWGPRWTAVTPPSFILMLHPLFYFHRLPLCLHCCCHSRRWVTLRWSPYISGRLIFGWKNIKMTNVEASARLWLSAPELEDKSLLKEIQTFVLIIVQRALTLQFKVSDCVGIKFEDISKRSHQFRVQWDKPAAKWASAHPYWSSQGSNQFSLLSRHYLWKPQTVYNKSAKCSKKSVQTRVSNFCLNSKAFLDVEDGQEERFRLSHLHNAVD